MGRGINVVRQPLGKWVQLKGSWEDPEGKSILGYSYRYNGVLAQPPWLDTKRFEAPMRRLWQQGASSSLPTAQAFLALARPEEPAHRCKNTRTAGKSVLDFL